ncbi:DUF1697 domain-containing protein [Paenibacillus rhizovicinus]|uniref:DUF1697 domain-containing protein n=1 Tax=Paenibacillus rhizovicinus TaxID=2704463 RepID=A0A6C0P8F1_9BACL|nr:DUF1697 domain-containing protein [Paenibacillus rhizovicinus]QHW34655.1 DUF1697 domain-containing protein [Paenibacillus rhizovicinus]
MTTYIALIRGINVGGKNKLTMADLKRELEAVGLDRVQTYIQSGNVVFRSEHGAGRVREEVEAAITRVSGIVAKVLIRTEAELYAIITGCPYAEEARLEGKSVHLSVLDSPLTEKQLDKLRAGISELDRYHVDGSSVYCHYGQSVLDSKLAGNFAKLGDGVTTRNWNTVLKLQAMAEASRSE